MNHKVAVSMFFVILLCAPIIAGAQSYSFIIEETAAKWAPPGQFGLTDAPDEMNRKMRKNNVGNRFSVELIGSYARVDMSWKSEPPFLEKVDDNMYFGSFGESGIYSLEFTKSLGRVNGGVFATTAKLPLDSGEEVVLQNQYFFSRR